MDLPNISPSVVGECAKYNFSPWYIKLRIQDQSPMKGRRWVEADKSLSSVLSTVGEAFEQDVYEQVKPAAREFINSWYDWGDPKNRQTIIDTVLDHAENNYDKPTVLAQARLTGSIGEFDVSGDADLIFVHSLEDGVRIHVVDIKSSWEEKPSQQIQTATYTQLIREIISDQDVTAEIAGGIFYRESDINQLVENNTTPSFEIQTRENDVQRVLDDSGPFYRAFTNSFDDLPINASIKTPYSDVAMAEAIEHGDLSIVGISNSVKQRLREKYNVMNLRDLAGIYEMPDYPKPYEKHDPTPASSVAKNIEEDLEISTEDITYACYRAKAILSKLDSSSVAYDKPWFPWIQGAGDGGLPDDDPPYETNLPMNRGSMVRVYLDVQHDYVRDEIVSVSGVITSSNYDGAETFSNVIETIDLDDETWKSDTEEKLLESSITEIYECIEQIAPTFPRVVPHFYIYDQQTLDNFYDAIIRHNDNETIESFEYFLDMRDGIDQKMFSTLEDEITSRMAITDPDTTVYNVVDYLYTNEDSAAVTDDDWIVDGVNLKEAYKQGLFDNIAPVKKSAESAYNPKVLNRTDESDTQADEFISLVPRSGSQIPIDYLWACKEIDLLDESWANEERQKTIINKYRSYQGTRLTKDHFAHVSLAFAKCLRHVERSVQYKNTDIQKEPVDFEEDSIGTPSLKNAVWDYMSLESYQTEREAVKTYQKPVRKRVIDGESLPIYVEEVTQENGYMFEAKATIILDKMNLRDPEQILEASEVHEGSRCVATPINENFETDIKYPDQIKKSPKISVYSIDGTTLTIRGYRTRINDGRFVEFRQPWSVHRGDDDGQYVGEGQRLILDPSPDNVMFDKAVPTVKWLENNPAYQDIQEARDKGSMPEDTSFDRQNIESYLDNINEHVPYMPNQKQKQFITNTNRYAMLQGPPGTGKTSGSVAHSILARAYDYEIQRQKFVSVVSGVSNKSVDEVMKSVSELVQMLPDDHPLSNINLVRLAHSTPDDPLENVEYLSYNADHDQLLLNGLVLNEHVGGNMNHTVLFTTTGKFEGLINKLQQDFDSEEQYSRPKDIFDYVVVDEASMMPLHQFFMTTAFVAPNGQIALAGDHRQLPPVQRYEWDDEYRKSIREHLPHLSVLNYFRALRGELETEYFDSPNVDIPMIRLDKSYRCHNTVANFLKNAVYHRDNINYYSEETDVLDDSDIEENPWITNTAPITLIVHNDRKSQKTNVLEQEIVSQITDALSDQISTGVITPHNAQKSQLRARCDDNIAVDTVERFQGGERDAIILSSTVSDPTFLTKEEEFIMSENRLNVALSRMKKKLVVVVSQSIFEMIPSDIETYEQAYIWKYLYTQANAGDNPDRETTVYGHDVEIFDIM